MSSTSSCSESESECDCHCCRAPQYVTTPAPPPPPPPYSFYYPAITHPLCYYSQIQPKVMRLQKKNSTKQTNVKMDTPIDKPPKPNKSCFSKAFEWYTKERCQNKKSNKDPDQDEEFRRFAEWLDRKYETYRTETTPQFHGEVSKADKSITNKVHDQVSKTNKQITDRVLKEVSKDNKQITNRVHEEVSKDNEQITNRVHEEVSKDNQQITNRVHEEVSKEVEPHTNRFHEQVSKAVEPCCKCTNGVHEEVSKDNKQITNRFHEQVSKAFEPCCKCTNGVLEEVSKDNKQITNRFHEQVCKAVEPCCKYTNGNSVEYLMKPHCIAKAASECCTRGKSPALVLGNEQSKKSMLKSCSASSLCQSVCKIAIDITDTEGSFKHDCKYCPACEAYKRLQPKATVLKLSDPELKKERGSCISNKANVRKALVHQCCQCPENAQFKSVEVNTQDTSPRLREIKCGCTCAPRGTDSYVVNNLGPLTDTEKPYTVFVNHRAQTSDHSISLGDDPTRRYPLYMRIVSPDKLETCACNACPDRIK